MARRLAAVMAVAVGVGLMAAAVLYLLPEVRSEMEFRSVAAEARQDAGQDGAAGAGQQVDWDYLDTLSPDIRAYLTVDNTNVDYPVVQATDNDYYLWRGLDGQFNETGTPYMDYRCSSPDAANVIVYGHHLANTHTVFDALSGAYDQAFFDGIGTVHWATRDAGTVDFKPAFAMMVREDYGKPFSFDFKPAAAASSSSARSADHEPPDSRPTFTGWLASMLADATAACSGVDALAGQSTRSLTLVTCSYPDGQPWRCLLVCVPEPKLSI